MRGSLPGHTQPRMSFFFLLRPGVVCTATLSEAAENALTSALGGEKDWAFTSASKGARNRISNTEGAFQV